MRPMSSSTILSGANSTPRLLLTHVSSSLESALLAVMNLAVYRVAPPAPPHRRAPPRVSRLPVAAACVALRFSRQKSRKGGEEKRVCVLMRFNLVEFSLG
ncbi:hypothetical protein Dimus_029989 [Dionaea muscipula]